MISLKADGAIGTSQNASIAGNWNQVGAYVAAMRPGDLAINGGLSILLIIVAAVASFAISRAAHALLRRLSARLGKKDDQRRSASHRAVVGLTQLVIWCAAIVFVLDTWGIDLLSWSSGPGAPLVANALRILAITVVAIAGWEGAVLGLDAVFRSAAANADTSRRAAQLRSLAPMLRGAVRTLIAIFAGLVIVSQLGVKIGPLLAGAGVVGIAVGFGAQTLVKDYLTGFLLVLEDILSVGDIVRIGDSGGLVETMSLRTVRLRDFDGTLHVIPYSEAQVVHNLTKTFSYYVFDLQISYGSNIDTALKVMRDVGAQMQADPGFRDKILELIEVVGVDALADSGLMLKARFKTAPIQQWNVGREYNRRIKHAFDKAGIEIPFPHVKIVLPDREPDAMRALQPTRTSMTADLNSGEHA